MAEAENVLHSPVSARQVKCKTAASWVQETSHDSCVSYRIQTKLDSTGFPESSGAIVRVQLLPSLRFRAASVAIVAEVPCQNTEKTADLFLYQRLLRDSPLACSVTGSGPLNLWAVAASTSLLPVIAALFVTLESSHCCWVDFKIIISPQTVVDVVL